MKFGTIIVHAALLAGSRPSSALPQTKRLRTKPIYKSEPKAHGATEKRRLEEKNVFDYDGISISIVTIGDPDEPYDPFLGVSSLSLPLEVETSETIETSVPTGSMSPSGPPVTKEPTESPVMVEQTAPTMCSFCQPGITAGNDFVIPDAEGVTCGQAYTYAGTIEDTTSDCAKMKEAEFVCCPTKPDASCDFCVESGGITVDASSIIPNSNGITCGLALVHAASLDGAKDLEECNSVQLAKSVCCPEIVLPEDDAAMSTDGPMSMTLDLSMPITVEDTPATIPPVGSTASPTQRPAYPTPPTIATVPTPMSPPSSCMSLGPSLFVALSVTIAGLQLL